MPTDPPTESAGASGPSWRYSWQLPLSVVGVGLLVLGLLTIARRAPGPDPEGVLADAAVLLERQNPGEALDLLNGPIVKVLDPSDADAAPLIARFHALRAEALFLAHQERRPDHSTPAARANNTRILDEFARAKKLDPSQIDPRRSAFIIETLVNLERYEEALDAVERLPQAESQRARRLLRRVVEETILGPPGRRKIGREALARFREQPGLEGTDRTWAVAQWARLELADARPSAVVDVLLAEVNRLELNSEEGLASAGELHLLLGKAYLALGEMERARTSLSLAETLILPGDARRGEVDVGLANIAQARGELEEARDRYAAVVERFPGTPSEAEALLGLGETEADLGRIRESLRAYTALVGLLHSRPKTCPVSPERAEASMEQRHRSRTVAHDDPAAIEYATLAVRAFPDDKAPPKALLRLGETHRATAMGLLERVRGGESPADREILEQARRHFEEAARAFERHTRAAMVDTPAEASDSLWNAADAFDRAGNQHEAVRLFSEFAHSRRLDPKHLEAKFRLARCFQSLNDYPAAIALYEEIIRVNPDSDEATRSHVPLAQCYLLQSSDADADKAEALLLSVLDGRVFEPEAAQFKQALLELGQMYLRVGRYPDAIARLTEAVERYPDAPERTRLRFDLADAMRLSAGVIESQLRQAMPLSERTELERLRTDRLRAALTLFEEVRDVLDRKDPASLTLLERIILRNAVLYRGDCAFDLGDYDLAIRHYDAAAQRLAEDPASLVPMVQIVNCYAALGRWPEARTAHQRARTRLREIPDQVWQSAAVPMNRAHWERWLDSSLRLEELEARASAATAEP